MPEDLDAWLRRAPIGDLNAIDAAVSNDTQDGVSAEMIDLRNRCSEIRNAHSAAMSALQTNLTRLATEVEYGKAVRKFNGAELLGVCSPELPARRRA